MAFFKEDNIFSSKERQATINFQRCKQWSKILPQILSRLSFCLQTQPAPLHRENSEPEMIVVKRQLSNKLKMLPPIYLKFSMKMNLEEEFSLRLRIC